MSQRHDIYRRYLACIDEPIKEQLRRTPQVGDYISRHNDGWATGDYMWNSAGAFRKSIESLALLAAEHEHRNGTLIAHDGFNGPAFLDMARGLRTMLSGFELGKLDAGFCDAAICNICAEAGFDQDEI